MKLAFAALVLLVACGDDGGARAKDAAVGTDGTIVADARAADAPNLPVTVTVTDNGSAAVGSTVYFLNADSSVVAETTTDAGGSASHVMAAGGSVTVVSLPTMGTLPPPPSLIAVSSYELDTIEGVLPGDHLKIATNDGLGATITIHVTAPAIADVSPYALYTTCGSGALDTPGSDTDPTTPVTDVELDDCPGTADMVVVAGTGSSAHGAYTAGEAIADGANVTLTTAYVPIVTAFATYTDVPAGVTDVEGTRELYTARGQLYATDYDVFLSAGSGEQTFYQPTVAGAMMVTESTAQNPSDLGYDLVVASQAPAATYTIDFGTSVLAQLTTAPTFDPTTHAVSWAEGSGGSGPPTVSLAQLQVSRSAAHFAWTWQAVAAHAGAKLTYPVVPTDVQDFNIAAADSFDVTSLAFAAPPGGYNAVRAQVLALDDLGELVAATAGTVAIKQYPALPSTPPPGRVVGGGLTRGLPGRRPARPAAHRSPSRSPRR